MRTLKNGLTRLLEHLLTLLVAILVLDVLWGVISRFVLSEPSRWTEELATFLLMWVALLGAAVGFSRQQHLGVDYLVNKLHPDAKRLMALLVQGVIIAFASVVMVGGGYVLVAETLTVGQLTPALGIRMGLVYLAVPLSGLFIILFSLEQMAGLIVTDALSPNETIPRQGPSGQVPTAKTTGKGA
jgi:TRAP-type C4-dicarboxylate transport system permease small subunit